MRKFIRSMAFSIANFVGPGRLHGHGLVLVGIECLAMPQNAPRDPGKLVSQRHGELVLVQSGCGLFQPGPETELFPVLRPHQ